jgi:hypothetical protein
VLSMKSKDPLDPMFGFELSDMNDVEFSKWLRRRGWQGDSQKLGEWTKFYVPLPKGNRVLAIVKFKNSPPVQRWIYIKTGV